MGFSDKYIGQLWGLSQHEMYRLREKHDIFPVYKMIDTCASEFSSYVPYFYSTYEEENESKVSDQEEDHRAGFGPRSASARAWNSTIRRCTRSGRSARRAYEAIIINNNPETVSTDYTTSDKLYFEPLTVEDVMNVIHLEKPQAIVVSLGGQTAINLAEPLAELGGSDHRYGLRGDQECRGPRVLRADHGGAGDPAAGGRGGDGHRGGSEGRFANRPIRSWFVRATCWAGVRCRSSRTRSGLRHYLQTAVEENVDQPVLVDRYIMGKELEVDAICDGMDVFIPGIMEHVEHTGIHSGDSISVYPTFSVSQKAKEKIIDYTVRLGLRIGIVGLYNIQFIVAGDDDVYVIEVNPRSSRTVPFLSKSTGVPMAHIATQVILGKKLRELGYTQVYGAEKARWYVKAPAFSFAKIRGMDSYLSPEMKSTARRSAMTTS